MPATPESPTAASCHRSSVCLPVSPVPESSCGRHSIPELVEVVREINLEVRDRLPIHSSRTLVGFHPLVGFPYFSLRNVKRLDPLRRAREASVRQMDRLAPSGLFDRMTLYMPNSTLVADRPLGMERCPR